MIAVVMAHLKPIRARANKGQHDEDVNTAQLFADAPVTGSVYRLSQYSPGPKAVHRHAALGPLWYSPI
jgi:hypothetical protein